MRHVKNAIQAWYNMSAVGAATNGCYHRRVPHKKKRPYTVFTLRNRPEETMDPGVDFEWWDIVFTIYTKGVSAEESDALFELLITAFDNEPTLNVLGFRQVRLDRGDSEQYEDPDAGVEGGWCYDVGYRLQLQRDT